MPKARWIITAISAALFFGSSLLTSAQDPWFQSLERPDWLTFEFLIGFIWAFIWICGTISVILVWEKSTPQLRPWHMAGLYLAIALLTLTYSPVVEKFHSLWGGFLVGGLATLLVYLLAMLIAPISRKAASLLVPYLIWGPIGTYLTWVLIQLNQDAINRVQ